jgi:hypothetical protein
VKKSNNKVSQHKIKRADKNRKRIKSKPYLSKFERKQSAIRQAIISGALEGINP